MFEIDLLLYTNSFLSCFPNLGMDARFWEPPVTPGVDWWIMAVPSGVTTDKVLVTERQAHFLPDSLAANPFPTWPQPLLPLRPRALARLSLPGPHVCPQPLGLWSCHFFLYKHPPHHILSSELYPSWKFISDAAFSVCSRYLHPSLIESLHLSEATFKVLRPSNPSLPLSSHHAQF